ncbi:alpha-L-rhamnosidase [Trichococcus patagoniensis]|uniref:alpha-L-rhamnosidase n=1 Tax=Trichococcus patagoniensis TaxID=382641 RepID=A0A2T5INL0_9LACT|nr:alpha-L-rhamnosidase [Trichococcus patagoniensis]PTQ85422.1 alpha-L-rhamnosidase [Trichococcus patagoniensis]
MKITIKINGLTEPKGYQFEPLLVSWIVTDAIGKSQKKTEVTVAKDADFEEVVWVKAGALVATGTKVDLDLRPRTQYFVKITVEDEIGNLGEGITHFETGKMDEAWEAQWIGTPAGYPYHPILSTDFAAEKPVKKAMLYMSGVGLYETYLNGEKVTDEVLTPFLNDYRSLIQAQTYDVTGLVQETNDFEILLGNGWYKGRYGLESQTDYFGDQFAAIAELHLMFEDGSTQVVKTDEEWQYRASNILASGIYDGETIDELHWNAKANPLQPVVEVAIDQSKLQDRISPPLLIQEEVEVAQILTSPAGETILDMGQNFAGWLSFEADFPAGTKIHLEFGEILQNGNFYNENYGTATDGFTFVSDGRKKMVMPHFTYFGFRYVRVSGWVGEIKSELFKGLAIYSDLQQTGFIETGHEKLNRLYQNTLWSQKSNFLDMPTDCPQRAERLGWTGDAQVYAPTASYHMDTRAFYRKFLIDMRQEQLKMDGSIPNYMPSMGSNGGAAIWGDAATIIPMTLVQMYGESEELALHYPLMKDWVEWNIRQVTQHKGAAAGLVDFGFQFGDWLGLDGATPSSFKGGTDDAYIATVYYCHSLELLAEAAELLGKEADARKYRELADQVRAVILHEYFTPAGRLSVDTQAAYIVALKFGIYRDKAMLLQQFNSRLKKDLYQIKCGFAGAPLLCQVLAENGLVELAYEFLLTEDYPGWLYAVNQGATTIWERWNSVLADGSMNPAGMNSLNHYSYGSVMEFVYQSVVGISPAGYGFSKVRLAPELHAQLKFVKGRYESTAGTYVSEWEILEDGQVHCHFEVPFDGTATIVLPNSNEEEKVVGAGVYDYTYWPTRDFRYLYDEHTRMSKVMRDDEAFAAVREAAPRIGEFLDRADKAQQNMTLKELSGLFYTGISAEMAEAALEKLKAFKA